MGNVKIEAKTIIDYLGPWPLRLVYIFLIVEAIFSVMTLAWTLPALRRRKPQTR